MEQATRTRRKPGPKSKMRLEGVAAMKQGRTILHLVDDIEDLLASMELHPLGSYQEAETIRQTLRKVRSRGSRKVYEGKSLVNGKRKVTS